MLVNFNQPYTAENAQRYVNQVIETGHLGIEGKFSSLCENWLEQKLQVKKVILTQSCTAALELSVRLSGARVGDEIILPSVL